MNRMTCPDRCANTHPSKEIMAERVENINKYVVKIPVSKDVLDRIERFLALPLGLDEDEYQGDSTIIYTVLFPNGVQADIKCCGCRDEAS